MKKILSAAILAGVLFAFSGCVIVSVDTYKDLYQTAVGTPEDSVVFYGMLAGDSYHAFSQMNPDFQPDFQTLSAPVFVSKPVAPGSRYILERNSGRIRAGKIEYYWDSYYSMQAPLAPVTVNVPKKPGLYYIGHYDGSAIARGDYQRKDKNPESSELTCLNDALKLYEGTAWEKPILERIEALKNKK